MVATSGKSPTKSFATGVSIFGISEVPKILPPAELTCCGDVLLFTCAGAEECVLA